MTRPGVIVTRAGYLLFLDATMEIRISDGDIGRKSADALIAPINSGGLWFGAIDRILQQSDYNYHSKAALAMPLHDGQVLIVSGMARFGDVIFIVDDLQQPLENLLTAALDEAEKAGYEEILLPMIRTGVMANKVETKEEVLEAYAKVLADFKSGSLRSVEVVIYKDYETAKLLRELVE